MSRIVTGNAGVDSQPTRHWLVGHFIPAHNIRHSNDVEIKWATHRQGDERSEWVTGEKRTSIALLISGTVTMEFRDRKCKLAAPGDYVLWGVGVDHRWSAAADSVVITIRWPSVRQ